MNLKKSFFDTPVILTPGVLFGGLQAAVWALHKILPRDEKNLRICRIWGRAQPVLGGKKQNNVCGWSENQRNEEKVSMLAALLFSANNSVLALWKPLLLPVRPLLGVLPACLPSQSWPLLVLHHPCTWNVGVVEHQAPAAMHCLDHRAQQWWATNASDPDGQELYAARRHAPYEIPQLLGCWLAPAGSIAKQVHKQPCGSGWFW